MTSKVSEHLMDDVLKDINIEAIEENVANGKVDMEALMETLSQLLSKDDIAKLLDNAVKIANTKTEGEHLTAQDISKVLENVTTVKKIQRKVAGGDIDIDSLKKTLTNITGEAEGNKLFARANQIAEQMAEKKDVA